MEERQPINTYTEDSGGILTTEGVFQQILNRRDPVEDLVDSLRGFRRDREGRLIHIGRDPLMNDFGIEAMVRKLKSFLQVNTILTNLDEEKARLLIRNIGFTITRDLRVHYREYGLKDTSQMSDVLWITWSNIIMALLSGQNGFTLSKLVPNMRHIENYKPEAKSWLDSMTPSFGHRNG